MDRLETVRFTILMAKILDGNTVITIQNEKFGTTVFESLDVTLSSLNKGLSYTLAAHDAVQSSLSCATIEGYSKEPEPTAHETQVNQHTGVILDVLKQVESTRLNAAIRREKLEAELADKERADRVTLRFAIFNATQAGVSEEEVVRRLRDDHANYVSDRYDEVREHTDLDTLATRA